MSKRDWVAEAVGTVDPFRMCAIPKEDEAIGLLKELVHALDAAYGLAWKCDAWDEPLSRARTFLQAKERESRPPSS